MSYHKLSKKHFEILAVLASFLLSSARLVPSFVRRFTIGLASWLINPISAYRGTPKNIATSEIEIRKVHFGEKFVNHHKKIKIFYNNLPEKSDISPQKYRFR